MAMYNAVYFVMSAYVKIAGVAYRTCGFSMLNITHIWHIAITYRTCDFQDTTKLNVASPQITYRTRGF